MVERIKKFGLRIWDKIEDYLALYIASFIIVIFLAVLLSLREWSFTKHTLRLYGIVWLLLLLLFLFLLGYSLCSILRENGRQGKNKVNKELTTNETDIKNKIRQWFKHRTDFGYNIPRKGYKFGVEFSRIDEEMGLAKGSAERFFEEVVAETGYCGTENKGQDTIVCVWKMEVV